MAARRNEAASIAGDDRMLLIRRTLAAPRPLVFAIWSRAEHLVHWLGPKDFSARNCETELRIGGRFRSEIVSPDGKVYGMTGSYREIDPPARLSFTFAWIENGQVGEENLITVDLAERSGGKTEMTFCQSPFPSREERDSHEGGWSECFDRLEAYLQRVP